MISEEPGIMRHHVAGLSYAGCACAFISARSGSGVVRTSEAEKFRDNWCERMERPSKPFRNFTVS
jgi:hypothetical protein